MKRAAPGMAIAAVILTYLFFGTYGEFHFKSRPWDLPPGRPADAYYAALGEGFLRGQLSMATRPDPRLMVMPNPYDYEARQQQNVPYLWDASYFNGRYYLYFTPLPALLFYIPARLLYGAYPSDQLASIFFAIWAFAMGAAFLKRALKTRHIPRSLWILLIGLGNVVAVVMVYSRTYEVAAFCGMALSATFAWCLLGWLDEPKTSRLLWTSIWLALAIAARPNLGLLAIVFLAAVLIKQRNAIWIALIPLAVTAALLATYNYARFHDPFEFGHRYQLTYLPMGEHRVCSCRTPSEALRLIHTAWLYTATPLLLNGDFPFARLTVQNLDPKVSFNEKSDTIGSLGAVLPLAILGTLFGILLALRKNVSHRGLFILGAGWLVLLGLSTCWYASARYELDFMLLIALGAIVAIEAGLTFFEELGVSLRPLRIAIIALACYSIAAGILLGFTGAHDAFKTENPELFHRLEAIFK